MNIRDIRDIMGLTQAQVADELGVPKQEVIDCEENGETYLLLQYISAFPINPQILRDPDADPFLPSFDQTTPGNRMLMWREQHGLAPSDVASAIGITPMELISFEAGNGPAMSRRRGEEIERKTGINRKWLMYGDGRVKGEPRLQSADRSPRETRAPKESHIPAPNKPAGLQIKKARLAAGLSREDLAEIINLSPSRIAQIESGYIKDKKAEHIISRIEAATGKAAEESQKDAGLRLRAVRKEAGLSVKEASEILGLKHTTLAHLESGYITTKHADELIEKLKAAPSPNASKPFSPKEAGARIREERIKAGLSQKELSTILHMPLTRISHVELGNVTEKDAENILRRIHGEPLREVVSRRVKPSDQVILGSNIHDARIRAKLSQKALGEMLQLPQTRISLIEKGKVDEATGKKILSLLSAVLENQKNEAGSSSPESASPEAPREEAAPAAGAPAADPPARKRAGKEHRPDLGKQLQEARLSAGLNQKAVADLLGVSQGSVSYMEQGRVDEETAEKVLSLIAEASKA